MPGKGKSGGRGGKAKNWLTEEEAVATTTTAGTAEAPGNQGNHGSASSSDEDPGSHRSSIGNGSPVSLCSGRPRKTKTPSRQDTRSTTTAGSSVATTRYIRPHNYRSKCPKFTGEKDKWPRFSDEFWLFLRELNESWDIHGS